MPSKAQIAIRQAKNEQARLEELEDMNEKLDLIMVHLGIGSENMVGIDVGRYDALVEESETKDDEVHGEDETKEVTNEVLEENDGALKELSESGD